MGRRSRDTQEESQGHGLALGAGPASLPAMTSSSWPVILLKEGGISGEDRGFPSLWPFVPFVLAFFFSMATMGSLLGLRRDETPRSSGL